MALTTYRYRRTSALDQVGLRSLVDSTVTLQGRGGRAIEDVEVDDTKVNDLDAIMAERGYVRITSTGTIEEAFRARTLGASEGESQTTETGYQEKLKVTTPILLAGKYEIRWSIRLKSSNSGRIVFVQVQLDDSIVLGEYQTDFDLYFMGIGGHKEETLTAAAHTVDVDFRADTGPTRTAFVKEVRVVVERVG